MAVTVTTGELDGPDENDRIVEVLWRLIVMWLTLSADDRDNAIMNIRRLAESRQKPDGSYPPWLDSMLVELQFKHHELRRKQSLQLQPPRVISFDEQVPKPDASSKATSCPDSEESSHEDADTSCTPESLGD